jgi:hypothetical protein
MRRFFTLLVAIVSVLTVSAQKKEKPATAWKTGGMLSIMGGQSGSRNWAPAGSEKFSLTGMTSLNLWASKAWGKKTWDNTLDLNYALINTSSAGVRKIDDKIDLYSKYGYALKKKNWGIGFVGNLRSQFTNGFDYTEMPRKRISGFFAPAYLVFSPGAQYRTTNGSFSAHAGLAARWVIVTNAPYSLNYQGGIKPDGSEERTIAELYGVDPERQVRFEVGPYVSLLFKKEVVKNVMWKTRLDLNSDVVYEEPKNVDVYWTNSIGMTVNKWLQVNYSFDLFYDDNVRMFGINKNVAATQMRSLLGVGLAAKF